MDVSYQLYSSRDAGPWTDTLKMLAQAGYTQVEGFGGVYGNAPAFRHLMDENGLTMPTGHFFPIGNFEDDIHNTLLTAKVLGMQRLFCPAPEDLWRDGTDAANWIALAKRLEEVGKRVRDAGFAFGWHNHHWEFMPLAGGGVAMDLILEHAPGIDWEMDVAWVVRGGADPLDWIARHGQRITTAHVKDIAPEGDCADEDGWADPGHGVMDWPGLMRALRGAGVDIFVMEHDKPNDATRFAQRAIAAFKGF